MTMPQLPPAPPMQAATAALAAPPAAPPPLTGGAPPPPVGAPVPPGLLSPAAPDAPPPLNPPTPVAPDATLKQRPEAKDIANPFERQATLIVDTAQDWASRLAKNLGEHPSDTVPADSSTVAEMYHYSPYGLDAPKQFWALHDQLLQTAMQANDPDPAAVAERGALDEVYPQRAKLGLLDSLGPEQRVQRAEQILQMAHSAIAQGNPPDAMAHIVGPAGLPPQEAPPAEPTV